MTKISDTSFIRRQMEQVARYEKLRELRLRLEAETQKEKQQEKESPTNEKLDA